MIKDFLIINFIGKDNKIGLRVNNYFYIHDFDKKTDNDQLVTNVLKMIKKYKVNIDDSFSVLVNNGPGSFSSLRTSLAVAKGIKISKKINIFGYKNSDLVPPEFSFIRKPKQLIILTDEVHSDILSKLKILFK